MKNDRKLFQKLFFFVAVALLIFLPACKFTEITGIGDGQVTIVENVMISTAVTAGLNTVPDSAQKAIHLVAAGLLNKIDSNDAISVAAIDKALPDAIAESGVTDAMVLAEVNGFAARVKAALINRLNLTDGSNAQKYLVGIRAVLNAIYTQTGGPS